MADENDLTDEEIEKLPQLMTDKELEALILAFARGRNQSETKQTFTIEEAEKLRQAGLFIRLSNLYLNLALSGSIYVDMDDRGSIVWVFPKEETNA